MSVTAMSEFLCSLEEDDMFTLCKDMLTGRVAMQVRLIEEGVFSKIENEFPQLREYHAENRHVLDPAPPEAPPARITIPPPPKPWWHPEKLSKELADFSVRCRHRTWIDSMEASGIFGLIIVINAVYIGYEVDNRPPVPTTAWLFMDWAFTLLFTLELAMRFRLHGKATITMSHWNQFDALMVFMAWFDTVVVPRVESLPSGTMRMVGVLRILRLAKILKVIKLLPAFQDLWIMCLSLVQGLKALFWIIILMMVFVYACAIVMTRMVGEPYRDEDEAIAKYWGSVVNSMYSLFIVMMGDGWITAAEMPMEYIPGTSFFFVLYICITNFALMNLVTGVIVDKVINTATETKMDSELEFADPKEEIEMLARAFETAQNDEGKLSAESLQNGLRKGSPMEEALRALQVFLGSNSDMLFNVLDANDNGSISLPEFVDGIARMKGSTQSKHMFFVHSDLHTISKRVYAAVDHGCLTMVRHLDCIEHMEGLVRDLWLLMQKQATNRWSSDPFHSSLHQMVGNIHELVAEMATRTLPPAAQQSARDRAAALHTARGLDASPAKSDSSFWQCGACSPVPATTLAQASRDLNIARVPDSALDHELQGVVDLDHVIEADETAPITMLSATPLRKAVRGGDLGQVQLLIQSSADVQETDPYWLLTLLDEVPSQTPLEALLRKHGCKHSLFYAASRADLELTRQLVDAQADVSATNHAGWRVLDFAARSPNIRQVLQKAAQDADARARPADDRQALTHERRDKYQHWVEGEENEAMPSKMTKAHRTESLDAMTRLDKSVTQSRTGEPVSPSSTGTGQKPNGVSQTPEQSLRF